MAKRRMSLVAAAAMAMMAVPGGVSVAQAKPAASCHLFPYPVNPILCTVRNNVACNVHYVASVIESYPPLPEYNCIVPE